jgi:hypothetical protein
LSNFRDDPVSELKKIAEMFKLFVESGCFSAAQTLCSTETLFQNSLRRSHFSTPAFANDDAEHFPNIFFRLEKFLPFAFANDTADESPTNQVAQIAVGISATNLELLHDVVGAKRSWRGNEERVNLSHGAIDSPGAAYNGPLTYKLVPRLAQAGRAVVSVVHVFSVNPENTVCQINSRARTFLNKTSALGSAISPIKRQRSSRFGHGSPGGETREHFVKFH